MMGKGGATDLVEGDPIPLTGSVAAEEAEGLGHFESCLRAAMWISWSVK